MRPNLPFKKLSQAKVERFEKLHGENKGAHILGGKKQYRKPSFYYDCEKITVYVTIIGST